MSFAPATWMGATDHRPGTSFENPLFDYHAQCDLISEPYYVLNSARHDIVRTTQGGLAEYIRSGTRFAILNKDGLRVLLQNGRGTVQKLQIYAIDPAENTLLRLNDRSWEFISVKTALAQAASDDTIYYDIDIKYFRRRIRNLPGLTPESVIDPRLLTNDGTSGTGATSAYESPVAIS